MAMTRLRLFASTCRFIPMLAPPSSVRHSDRRRSAISEERYAATRGHIVETDRHAMHAGDRVRQAQSETVAGRVPACLATIEAAQHRLPLLRRDPRAVVSNRDAEAHNVVEQMH